MSTLVIYSDTSDGYIESYTPTSYAVARAGSESFNLVADTTNPMLYISQSFSDSGDPDYVPIWDILESFVSFDTSSIGSGSSVSAAVLRLTSYADFSTTDFDVEARLNDWGAALTTADWVPGANLSGKTLLAHYATSGGFVVGTGYDFVDDAMVANVNKTGSTRMVLASSRMRTGTIGAQYVDESVLAYAADYAGTTYDPRLTVTYSGAEVVSPAGVPLVKQLIRMFG